MNTTTEIYMEIMRIKGDFESLKTENKMLKEMIENYKEQLKALQYKQKY